MTKKEAIRELEFILVGHPETSARGQAVLMALEALEQPEQKKGKWIEVEKVYHTRFHSDQPDTYHEYRCTVCLKASDKATNYCPNCGSKMEE